MMKTSEEATSTRRTTMDAILSQSRHIIIFVFLTILPLAVHGQNKGTAIPPEVKKTVESFLGHWTLTGTYTEPNSKTPSHLTVTIDCESAARGMAVNCRMASDETGGGHVEAASVIGYSPDEQLVRLMEISSSGSYHDHKGPWRGNEIQFEPLTYSISGKKVIEYFAISFPSLGKITVKSVTETTEG